MKSLTLKTLLLTLSLMSTSTWAFTGAYKLILIDDGDLASFIESGDYQKALESVTPNQDDPNSRFVGEFNRCVASIHLSHYKQAETLCSKALDVSAEMNAPSHKRRELISFALSNRAMARLKLSKTAAAIVDLYEASKISSNDYVQANLKTARDQLALTD